MGETVHNSVDGVASPDDVVDATRTRLRRAVNSHPFVGWSFLTVVALLGVGVGLALLEPGNPDNTAMLNVFASLAIILAYTMAAAAVVVGAVMGFQWAVTAARTNA